MPCFRSDAAHDRPWLVSIHALGPACNDLRPSESLLRILADCYRCPAFSLVDAKIFVQHFVEMVDVFLLDFLHIDEGLVENDLDHRCICPVRVWAC